MDIFKKYGKFAGIIPDVDTPDLTRDPGSLFLPNGARIGLI